VAKLNIAGGTGGNFDALMKQNGTPAQIWFLDWDGIVLFKPFGVPDGRTGIQPMILSGTGQDVDYSNWFFQGPSLVRCGTEKFVSFLISPESTLTQDTPYHHMHHFARKNKKKDLLFSNLVTGEAGKGAPLSPPKDVTFLQGAMLAHGDNNYTRAPKLNAVLVLPRSAYIEFGTLVAEGRLKEGGPQLGAKFPDLLHPAGGCRLRFKQKGAGAVDESANAAINFNNVSAGATQAKATMETKGYAVEILPDGPYNPPLVDLQIKNWMSWNSIFRFLNAQEQIQVLCSAFTPEATMKCFQGTQFEEYVPALTKNAWVKLSGRAPVNGLASQPSQPAGTDANPFAGMGSAQPQSEPANDNPFAGAQPSGNNPFAGAQPAQATNEAPIPVSELLNSAPTPETQGTPAAEGVSAPAGGSSSLDAIQKVYAEMQAKADAGKVSAA
jgi:hypothetical protein